METHTHFSFFPIRFAGENRRIFAGLVVNIPHPPESGGEEPEKKEDTPPQVEKPGDEAQAATTAQEKIGNTQQQREAMLKNQEARAKALREGEKGPETKDETHLDRLMGNFDSAVKEHDDAEAKAAEVRQKLKNDPENPELQKELKQHEMEKIKAVIKAFATFFEGLKRLFNGTLFESSKGDGKGSESAAQKPPEGVANKPAALTPEQQVQNELAKNKPKSAQETQAALGEIRENADNKIKENAKSIESLDKRIDGIKKENDVLIGKKGEVVKELNALRGEEGKEDKVFELQTELERLNTLIQANQKAIDTLDARRDALKKENTELTAKRDAAEKMGEDMVKGMEKLLPMLQKLAEMLGLKLQDLNIGYNGQPIIVINNINGNNNTVTNTLNAMGAKINPETQTAEVSAEQIPQNVERSKDAQVGQIREDKDGNYWQKTEKGWVSYSDAAKKMNSDSGYRGVTWFDSQMDENTKRIVENTNNTAPSAPAEKEKTEVEENNDTAQQAKELKEYERNLRWHEDLQQRMKDHHYDLTVDLHKDDKRFVLTADPKNEKSMDHLDTVMKFAEQRGMKPEIESNNIVAINIEDFIDKTKAGPDELTGYVGPNHGLLQMDQAMIAEANQKIFADLKNVA